LLLQILGEVRAAFVADVAGATVSGGIGEMPVAGGFVTVAASRALPVAGYLRRVTWAINKRQFSDVGWLDFRWVIAASESRTHGATSDAVATPLPIASGWGAADDGVSEPVNMNPAYPKVSPPLPPIEDAQRLRTTTGVAVRHAHTGR